MRNISEECSRENLLTHFILNNSVHKHLPLVRKGEQIYGTFRYATDDNKTPRMRFECRMIRATNTHIKSLIISFPG